MTAFTVIFCKKCGAGFRTERQLRKHMIRHIHKKGDALSKAILNALRTGPKSITEIAEFVNSRPDLVGLKIRHEFETFDLVRYDFNIEKWELNL